MAVTMASNALARRVNHTEYSPAQMVLGRQPRDPWSLLDKPVRSNLAAHDGALTTQFAKRVAMQTVAQRALVRLDTDRSLRKALLARNRNIPDSMQLQVGDLAYFWREGRAEGKMTFRRWHGPAVVLGKEGLSGIYLG